MSRKAIGIEIGRGHVRAVQIVRTGGGPKVEKAWAGECGAPESVEAALRALFGEHGFSRRAKVAVAMPHGAVFFRRKQCDARAIHQARQMLRFELEDDLPIAYDDLVVDVCGPWQPGQETLVGAVSRAELHKLRDSLAGAGIRCAVVDAAACAVHAATSENRAWSAEADVMIIHLDGDAATLAVMQGGQLADARSVVLPAAAEPDVAARELAREVELTWHGMAGGRPKHTPLLLLSGEAGQAAALGELLRQSLGWEVQPLDALGKVQWPCGIDRDPRFTVAAGLALRASAADVPGMNFLDGAGSRKANAAGIRKHVMATAVLGVALAASWCVGLFLKLNGLEREYQQLKTETRQVFQKTLPQETKIVSELQQMEERLRALRKEYDSLAAMAGEGAGGAAPLDVLERVSASVAAGLRLRVSDLSVAGRAVRMTGTLDSFKAVDDLKGRLQRVDEFGGVAVQDVGMDRATGAVRFTLTFTVRSG